MNLQVLLSTLQPFLTQLLQDPAFQAVIKKILDDILAKIAAGVHPTTATNQAAGQIGAAALLHLTGNPVADIQALFSSFKTSTGSTGLPPAPTPTGKYNS